ALAQKIGGVTVFADKIDRATTQVSRFMGKGATRTIGTKMARHIEQRFEMPEGWLDADHTKPSYRRIPIISPIQASSLGFGNSDTILNENSEWLITSDNISNQAFAMPVTGNSMTNPNGFPSIPAGAIVVVEPCDYLDTEKIIVAKLNGVPEVIIKKLEIDGPHQLLTSLNPKYEPIIINANCRIIGYVKQVVMNL
ncbi:MAG: LexA family transcriptional repressor, partial [Vibrio sp.]|nr:LexA family transcriptional repressor [Vibrio sp.]